MASTTGKLKIGIICHPTIGGSGIVATELGLKLAKKGHEIHFISYEKPFRLTKLNSNLFFHQVPINEYSLFRYPDYTLPLATTISDVNHKFKLDVIHAHYAVPHATAALLAREICQHCIKHFPKIITTLHGTDISLLSKDKALAPIIKYSIEKSDYITTVSEWLKKETYKILKVKKDIEVIHNFFEASDTKYKKSTLKTHLGFSPKDFILIHLSNLRPVKRIPDLLKIIYNLKNHPEIKLIIASGGDFSPFLPLVKKYDIENQIKIFPNAKNIQKLISASDAGIFTSESESFGLSILECMSLSLPVVTSNAGGIKEIIEHQKDGLLFGVGQTDTAARLILHLVKNEKERNKLGYAAKNTARKKFNPNTITNLYLKLYQA